MLVSTRDPDVTEFRSYRIRDNEVTEEFEEQWARLGQDDPQWAAFEVYAWLGAVQESLVQALA